jgi:hypothetical protein
MVRYFCMIVSKRWFEFDVFENTQTVRFTPISVFQPTPNRKGHLVRLDGSNYESRNKMNRLVGSFDLLSGTVTHRRPLFQLYRFQPDLKIQGFIMRSAPPPDGVPFPGDCFQKMV